MPAVGVVVLGLLSFLGLYALTFYVNAPTIQDDLTARAVVALQQQGLDSVAVTIDGRDAVLTGESNKAGEEQATTTVAKVWGIRVVTSNIDTSAEEARLIEQAEKAEIARRARSQQIERKNRRRCAPCLFDRVVGCFQLLHRSPAQHDGRAVPRKRDRNRAPDAGTGAGDHDHAIGQQVGGWCIVEGQFHTCGPSQ